MSLPAAAGYPQYSGNLTHEIFSATVLKRFYCDAITPGIVSSDFIGEIGKCGDVVHFDLPPRAVIHKYKKNQRLVTDYIETTRKSLTIDCGHYWAVKMDDVDLTQICNSRQLLDAYSVDATRQMGYEIDRQILCCIPSHVDCHNQGQNAGIESGAYNLGVTGNPLALTCDNVLDFFFDIQSVISEQCVGNRVWIVIPKLMYNLLLKSKLGHLCCNTELQNKVFLNGQIPTVIAGLRIHVSDNVCRSWDPSINAWVYQILAGTDMSIFYADQIEKIETVNPADYFGSILRGLHVYGFGVLYPETLALGTVRFPRTC